MEYWIKDTNTKRVVKSSPRQHKVLGANWRRVPPPLRLQKVVKPEKKEIIEEVVVNDEMTKQEYIAAIKGMNLGLKSIHLYSLEKLKKTYESNQQKDR